MMQAEDLVRFLEAGQRGGWSAGDSSEAQAQEDCLAATALALYRCRPGAVISELSFSLIPS